VLRYLRGDTIVSVWVTADPVEALHKGGRGGVDSRAKERECPLCEGYVRNLPPTEDRTGTGSSYYLPPECPKCEEVRVTELAACYAGDISTEFLSPTSHSSKDAQIDNLRIRERVKDLPTTQRDELTNRAKTLASRTVLREQKAIAALAHSLNSAEGKLTGEKAVQIIKDNLLSEGLYG
jgi:hypothetical protein